MILNLSALYVSQEDLQNMLAPGVNVNDITSSFQLPNVNAFTAQAEGLLPANLTTFNDDGVVTPLPRTTLEETISANLNSMSDIIKNSIRESIEYAISTQGQIQSNPELELVNKLTNELAKNVDSVISEVQRFYISLNRFNNNNLIVSRFNSAVESVVKENVDNFTNKQIRDLTNDEIYFSEILDQIFYEAVNRLKGTVLKELQTASTPSQSITSSINTSTINFKISPYDILSYLRIYYSEGIGADPDTFSGLTVMNTRLVGGRTCAVDNSTILLNSKVIMPDGREFLAVDSFVGSAVRPAIYLYFNTREEGENYLNSLNYSISDKLNIRVIPPPASDRIPRFDRPEGTNISIRGLEKDLV